MNVKKFSRYVAEAKEESFPVNQGHAYEFVLAAAMVARFTDRFDGGEARPLTAKSVMEVMVEYYRGQTIWQVDEGDDEIDVVEFNGGGLPQAVHDTFRQAKFRKHSVTTKMIEDAIVAVNKNRTLTSLSTDVITNGKPDQIDVVCGGTTGQMVTKSDVDIYINNREARKAGISVKYGGTQQGTQFAGRDAVKNLIDGFNSFNIDVSRLVAPVKKAMTQISGVYEPPADANDPVIKADKAIMFPAVMSVFRSVVKKHPASVLKNKRFAIALMNGLRKANIGTEDDLEVIRTGTTFDKKTFEEFGKYISDAAAKGNAEFKLETGSNPTLGLYANGNKMFQLRFRYDRDPVDRQKSAYKVRFRLYVENGKFLDSLADEIT